MAKRSVTLLQRDANDGSPCAEAGQASCGCSTKPPGRRKCEDQGQEDVSGAEGRRFPKQIQRPPEKNQHVPTSRPRSRCCWEERRSQPSSRHGQQPSTGQPWAPCSMSTSAWELLKKGFHGNWFLRALLIFHKVCSHLWMQAPANTPGAVIILTLHRLQTCKDGYFKSKRWKRSLLSSSSTCFCSSAKVWHCSSRKSFQYTLFVTESNFCSTCWSHTKKPHPCSLLCRKFQGLSKLGLRQEIKALHVQMSHKSSKHYHLYSHEYLVLV